MQIYTWESQFTVAKYHYLVCDIPKLCTLCNSRKVETNDLIFLSV